MDQALVATGFGYDARRRARQAELLAVVLPRVRDVRRMGAASLDLCAVATGRVDGYYEQGLKPWDLAAGGLVAEEAGARVAGLHGRAAGEALVVAARGRSPGRWSRCWRAWTRTATRWPDRSAARPSGDGLVLLGEPGERLDLAEPDLRQVVVAVALRLVQGPGGRLQADLDLLLELAHANHLSSSGHTSAASGAGVRARSVPTGQARGNSLIVTGDP